MPSATRVVELVDTLDLKSNEHCVRTGSSPVPGTNKEKAVPHFAERFFCFPSTKRWRFGIGKWKKRAKRGLFFVCNSPSIYFLPAQSGKTPSRPVGCLLFSEHEALVLRDWKMEKESEVGSFHVLMKDMNRACSFQLIYLIG